MGTVRLSLCCRVTKGDFAVQRLDKFVVETGVQQSMLISTYQQQKH